MKRLNISSTYWMVHFRNFIFLTFWQLGTWISAAAVINCFWDQLACSCEETIGVYYSKLLIAYYLFFIISFSVSIESKCKGIAGLKSVDIIWKLPYHKDFSNLTSYRVSYCTSGPPCYSGTIGQYQLGCTLNRSHSLEKELKCTIIAKDLFPFQFYFKVDIQTSDGVRFRSGAKACRLLTNSKYIMIYKGK